VAVTDAAPTTVPASWSSTGGMTTTHLNGTMKVLLDGQVGGRVHDRL
jgi:hypothetical protein